MFWSNIDINTFIRNLSIKVPGTQTNNNAEIFSTIKAIERVYSTGN